VDFKFWLANLTLPHTWLCQLCVVLIAWMQLSKASDQIKSTPAAELSVVLLTSVMIHGTYLVINWAASCLLRLPPSRLVGVQRGRLPGLHRLDMPQHGGLAVSGKPLAALPAAKRLAGPTDFLILTIDLVSHYSAPS
jgi:hypothetical protein